MASKWRMVKRYGKYFREQKKWYGWGDSEILSGNFDQAKASYGMFIERQREYEQREQVVSVDDTSMPMPESIVKGKVKKILDSLGAYWLMPNTGGYGNSGACDFVCCIAGKMVGIECKAGKNNPTALQLKHKRDIEASGGYWYLANENNLEELTLQLIYLKENKS